MFFRIKSFDNLNSLSLKDTQNFASVCVCLLKSKLCDFDNDIFKGAKVRCDYQILVPAVEGVNKELNKFRINIHLMCHSNFMHQLVKTPYLSSLNTISKCSATLGTKGWYNS